MRRKDFFLFCLLFIAAPAAIAQMLPGSVQDSASGAPLIGASVFINSSSIGTMTTDNGRFGINTRQLAEFDLIVSYVGYNTASIHIVLPYSNLVVRLTKKENVLDEVTVTAADKNGWNRWGALFRRLFIRTGKASKDCIIMHPEMIRFQFSKKNRLLSAYTIAPLRVINKYLGYQIDFDLTKFEIDFNSQRVVYKGFPRFVELAGNSSRKKGWANNRKQVYFGSFMHFLRKVQRGALEGSAYTVRKVMEKENVERTRVKVLTSNFDSATLTRLSNDSLYYYRRIQSESDVLHYLSKEKIVDSQFVVRDSEQVTLNFDGMIYVVYKWKKQEKEYSNQVIFAPRDNDVSGLMKLIHKPVLITQTGQYFPPDDVFLDGYWGWFEKVSNQLPVDYVEPEEPKPKMARGTVAFFNVGH